MQKAILRINTLKDIEETQIRLWLKQEESELIKLQMLINFRPDASLRAINNQRKLNLGDSHARNPSIRKSKRLNTNCSS